MRSMSTASARCGVRERRRTRSQHEWRDDMAGKTLEEVNRRETRAALGGVRDDEGDAIEEMTHFRTMRFNDVTGRRDAFGLAVPIAAPCLLQRRRRISRKSNRERGLKGHF